MKIFKLCFAAGLLLSAFLMGFTAFRTGGIQGKILPAAGVSKVIAVSGKDTLVAELKSGNIVFRNVKAATYTLLVEGKPPYKGTSIENVAVIDSTITDIGEIHLDQ
jgi:hypothetical protein